MAAKRSKETKKALSYLPHNINAEKAVLGSALISKDALFNVLSSLDENDFYLTQLEIAIQTIMFYSRQKITNNETQLIQKMVLVKFILHHLQYS